MCAGDHERVEWMERTNPDETGASDVVQHAREAPAGNRSAPSGDRTVPAAAVRAMTTFSAADEEKQRGVRRMKLTAAGLLLFVALVYVLAKWASHEGAGAWAGYVAAAAEAGMVGALADGSSGSVRVSFA